MHDLRERIRALDEARKRLPRRKAYSVVALVVLGLLVYGGRPGSIGHGGWRGPTGEVLAYVRCGWANDVTVHFNPRLGRRQRELASVHESVHVADAREAGCFLFNLSGRLSPRVRLEREARAHCAELHHRLQGLAEATAFRPDAAGRRRWGRALALGRRRILMNLMSVEAYAGIAALGRQRVEASVLDACSFPDPWADRPAASRS